MDLPLSTVKILLCFCFFIALKGWKLQRSGIIQQVCKMNYLAVQKYSLAHQATNSDKFVLFCFAIWKQV